MTKPRKELVAIDDTPYYHITSRCVRRAFLCGFDKDTQTDYEHRRQWIVDRLRLLSSLFSIDLCAYAVMSNHYHIAVKLNPEESLQWSDHEVIERWTSVFKGPLLIQQLKTGKQLTTAEQKTVNDITATWRQRLTDLSWFMKCLNEPLARMANKEDHCSGHFWEARFNSQALLTETSLLSCMAYIDLNPIRANMANTPEKPSCIWDKFRLQLTKYPYMPLFFFYPVNVLLRRNKNIFTHTPVVSVLEQYVI